MLDLLYKLFLERDTSPFRDEKLAVVDEDIQGCRAFYAETAMVASYVTIGGSIVNNKKLHAGYHPVRVAKFTKIQENGVIWWGS